MRFSSIFSFKSESATQELPPAHGAPATQLPIAPDTSRQPLSETAVSGSQRDQSGATGSKIEIPDRTWFLPTQALWVTDPHPLKIMEKSRQVGATKTDAFDSVLKASPAGARFDVWVTSRDEIQARLYLEDCAEWARLLHLAATDLGVLVLDPKTQATAQVLQFANGRRIYCLSSNPNALAGKRGHVKMDEFALHPDQRQLFYVAKACGQWGGSLHIFSTHRGRNTLFYQIIDGIRHHGNPMNFHLFSFPIQKAVEEGIVQRINEKSGRNETDEQFLKRTRSECIDEEQWLQEYCCIPADESAAFITHEMITACVDPHLRLLTFEELLKSFSSSSSSSNSSFSGHSAICNPKSALYLGIDVARKDNLCVIDVGEKIGDVTWDRCRIELKNATFSEIEFELYRLLALPQLKRACIDATGMGMQLAERARDRFGWKVEAITFTPAVKEELAFGLRRDFEDLRLRIVHDDALRSDLRALRKQVTASGNIRFDGEAADSHCDRTWAKALRQHAARYRITAGGAVA